MPQSVIANLESEGDELLDLPGFKFGLPEKPVGLVSRRQNKEDALPLKVGMQLVETEEDPQRAVRIDLGFSVFDQVAELARGGVIKCQQERPCAGRNADLSVDKSAIPMGRYPDAYSSSRSCRKFSSARPQRLSSG